MKKKKKRIEHDELKGGMGMGVGDHKFKNAMTGSLRNSWGLDLVLLDVRWRAPRPDKVLDFLGRNIWNHTSGMSLGRGNCQMCHVGQGSEYHMTEHVTKHV